MRYRLFFLRKTSKRIIQNKAPLVILLYEILVLVLNQVCSSSLYFPLFASDIPMIPADFWCHCQCNTDDTPLWLPAIIITALLSDFMCNSALLYFQSEAMHPDCAVVVQHMKAQEECNQILKQENNHSSRTGLWVLWSRFPPCSLRLSLRSTLCWLDSCHVVKLTGLNLTEKLWILQQSLLSGDAVFFYLWQILLLLHPPVHAHIYISLGLIRGWRVTFPLSFSSPSSESVKGSERCWSFDSKCQELKTKPAASHVSSVQGTDFCADVPHYRITTRLQPLKV